MPKTKMSSSIASTPHFKRLIRLDLLHHMQSDLEKLLKNCPKHELRKYEEENKGFLKLFEKFISSADKPLVWDQVDSFPIGALLNYNNFISPTRAVMQHFLEILVVVKLNGGLGTRMKCNGPKSIIPVRNGLSFIDLTVQQIENLNEEYNTKVPLVLMNSFNTTDETEKVLRKYKDFKIKIYTFEQDRYPRIYEDTHNLLPSSCNDDDRILWYPPGHGNFYDAFEKSGLLDEFRAARKEFVFISNIDNLGATVDCRILEIMTTANENKAPEFLMEVTKKTAADIKGGTLVQYNGKLKLLEYAEVPRDYIEEFKCARIFKNFNTNNLWVNIEAIKRIVMEKMTNFLDVIVNKKQTVIDCKKTDIIQLETAAGAAIELFDGAVGIMVPRSRFLPVKTTSDLFLLRSNVYINENGNLIMNPLRPTDEVPIISLDDEHFGNYRELDQRFETMPDCLELHHLTVCGNVFFGKDIVLKGNVTIVAHNGERLDIPGGSNLHNKIVTGTLRIVEF